MSLVSNEAGTLMIEYKTWRLATSGEGNFHLAFGNLIHITIGWDSVEISFLVLSWAEERYRKLEKFFVICLSDICHIVFKKF